MGAIRFARRLRFRGEILRCEIVVLRIGGHTRTVLRHRERVRLHGSVWWREISVHVAGATGAHVLAVAHCVRVAQLRLRLVVALPDVSQRASAGVVVVRLAVVIVLGRIDDLLDLLLLLLLLGEAGH